jgi:magnesium chelatase family protein
MVSHVKTVAFEGIEAMAIEVQVQIASGLPAFTIVGLPDKAVAESRERVRAALASIGLALPAKKIIVNLAPADKVKEGSHFDLPIALGVLTAMNIVPQDAVSGFIVLGELSLDGSLLPVAGVLPAAMLASALEEGVICPEASGREALWASGNMAVLAPPSLLAFINHAKGKQILAPFRAPPEHISEESRPQRWPDMKEVRGQHAAKRALEVAAAGGHNLLLVGPPGSGKSMLSSCLPGILPPLSPQEMLESSLVASVAGKLQDGKLTSQRPYRDPHHSSSTAAMVGGGRKALPGEISLAHRGVLFLDEFPEFPRAVLESLRQPLETGRVSVARAQAHVTYPADFQLIAAMNPCRCGYLDDAGRACNKAPRCAVDYQAKISGPLLDRIDIHIEMPAVDTLSMLSQSEGESSKAVAKRIADVRNIQLQRYEKLGMPHIRTNASVTGDALTKTAPLAEKARLLLEEATRHMQLSMRGYTRILRVARTIADLERCEILEKQHIAEAVSYRKLTFGRFG